MFYSLKLLKHILKHILGNNWPLVQQVQQDIYC